jgi:hypothetical protein
MLRALPSSILTFTGRRLTSFATWLVGLGLSLQEIARERDPHNR